MRNAYPTKFLILERPTSTTCHRNVIFKVQGFGLTSHRLEMSFYKLPNCPIRGMPVIFTPLDEDSVVTVNPREVDYWCTEFGCTEAQLRNVVARVGEHAMEVRRELMFAVDSSRDSWNKNK